MKQSSNIGIYAIITFSFLLLLYLHIVNKKEIDVIKHDNIVKDTKLIDSIVTAKHMKLIDSINTELKLQKDEINKLKSKSKKLRNRIDSVDTVLNFPKL